MCHACTDDVESHQLVLDSMPVLLTMFTSRQHSSTQLTVQLLRTLSLICHRNRVAQVGVTVIALCLSVCLSVFVCVCALLFSPVSIQTQALIGWRLRLLKNASAISQQECLVEAAATMIGCLPPQALAFLAVFVHATHATQAIAFEWKPGLTQDRTPVQPVNNYSSPNHISCRRKKQKNISSSYQTSTVSLQLQDVISVNNTV